MIITCPRCQKSFNIDDKLIPTEGRLVKCGACDHTWFFKPTENIDYKQDAATPDAAINEEENKGFIDIDSSIYSSIHFLVLPTPDCIDVLVGLYILAFFFVINGRGGRI